MAASASAKAALELAEMEIEAKAKARRNVANMLQRPDQLEKVEQLRKRVSRKKASVEAMLKTAVQSQLDGVRTGMNQLHNALKDVQEIKQGLESVDVTYNSITGLKDKLSRVQQENAEHSGLASAVENLKHIFTVPETVKKCEDYITDGKLLYAHKCLTDLESCRDDLLFELHKQINPSPTDKNTVNRYFAEVEKLSESLGKQLWLILQRTIMTLRREPTIIVTMLRIIEREERTDGMMLKRYDQTGFLPPGRPKRWRQKAFQTLEGAVLARIEGNQMEDRSMNKMWLVRHLEVTRQIVIDDLNVIKTLCDSCFPPHYDIVNKYVEMYHNAISQHLNDVVQQGLEGNEVVGLLTWVDDYRSNSMMGHPDLQLDANVQEFPPLLEQREINELQRQYLQTMDRNFCEWMAKSLNTDVQDWQRDKPPDCDEKKYYHTQLPVILFQMIDQNLQVASTINETLVQKAVMVCMEKLAYFARDYKEELQKFKEKHLQDRTQPPYFLHYMMANINNCEMFGELTTSQIQSKYKSVGDASPAATETQRCKDVSEVFHKLAYEVCDLVLEEVFIDLDPHVQKLVTREWVQGSQVVDVIAATMEDYCDDFSHLKDAYYHMLLQRARDKVVAEYIKALFTRKITFKNYEERAPAAEKICSEGEALSSTFHRLFTRNPMMSKEEEEDPFAMLPALAEVLKLRDTSMMSLELTGLVQKYPDVRIDQIVNLLLMRGDIGRNDARTLVIDCLGEGYDMKPKSKTTIVSKLYA